MVSVFTSFIDGFFSMFFPAGINLSITTFFIFSGALVFLSILVGNLIRGKF